MRTLRKHARYPRDNDLIRVVSAAASRVSDKLATLDIETLDVSDATKNILRDESDTLPLDIQKCARVFAWALPADDAPFSDLAVVAFGDGLGILSLLAKECSIGTVVYTGADDAVCRDASTIAKTLGVCADYYVFGDIEDVRFFLKRHSIPCDVFVSCDGTEQIEKPKIFFDTLYDLTDEEFSFGLSVRAPSPGCTPAGSETPGPYALRDLMIRTGFKVDLLRCPGDNPGGTLPRLLGNLIPKNLRGLAVNLAGGRPPDNRIGSHNGYILRGIRPARERTQSRPARVLQTQGILAS